MLRSRLAVPDTTMIRFLRLARVVLQGVPHVPVKANVSPVLFRRCLSTVRIYVNVLNISTSILWELQFADVIISYHKPIF